VYCEFVRHPRQNSNLIVPDGSEFGRNLLSRFQK
jgi:hypothetical protein